MTPGLVTGLTAPTRRRYTLDVGEVLCRGCGVPTGLSSAERGSQRNSLYHHPWCVTEPPVTRRQERNDLWRALHAIYGLGTNEIAALDDVLPSQVSRVLKYR